MISECTKCGRTESQITAEAKTLGLLQEFQSGVYTCYQISEWAQEQCLAWAEARQEDSNALMTRPVGPSLMAAESYSFPSAFAGSALPGTEILVTSAEAAVKRTRHS